MFYVTKTMEVAVGHCLALPYESKCSKVHGHNLKISVTVSAEYLTEVGMVIDFARISEIVNELDHNNLNEIMPEMNPTAEHIAKWISHRINLFLTKSGYPATTQVSKVTVQESEGNVACYEP